MLTERPASGSGYMSSYTTPGDESGKNVFLAFSRIWKGYGDQQVYLLVYRPAVDVFSMINVWASLAAFVCGITIIVLCIKAYRDVHNDIVRPVSLLNEGAQIVRQGDFDLKLKIGTGDEIEELANSFNKMAVALKRNMRQRRGRRGHG